MDEPNSPENAAALLVFDVDGTLFQTDRVTVPAVQRTFLRFGLPLPGANTVRSFFGRPVADYEAWLASQCPPGQAHAIVEATNELELALIGEEGALYPGVRETLAQLACQGYTMAICSNGPEAYVAEFVRAMGLAPLFSMIKARGDRTEGKDVMAGEILAELGARPLVVIGDRHDDIDAAHAHGGFGIAASYGFGGLEEWGHADARLNAFDELPSLLRTLLRGRATRH